MIHPQSYVHSIVRFKNGLIKMILYNTDMKIPISNTLYGRDNHVLNIKKIDAKILSKLSFQNVNTKNIFLKFSIKYYLTHIASVFNLAQLSVICMSFIDSGFLLAYLLKSLSLKILFMVLTIVKKLIFLAKNKLTNTSFDALTIVGVKKPRFKHLLINLIDGKRFVFTF